MTRLSVCIPTYDMHGEGATLLARSFDMLSRQTFKDFDVVVTDNSENDFIRNLCGNENYKSLQIHYYKNPRKGMAHNTNEAIMKATGELIKILYQDDFLADEHSLEKTVQNFTDHWLVSACKSDKKTWRTWLRGATHFPRYTDTIRFGKNTIGSPSVLTIKNEDPLLFDETMTWMLDCDYYVRLYQKYGAPTVLNEATVIIGVGKHQTTNHLADAIKQGEYEYMVKKHGPRT